MIERTTIAACAVGLTFAGGCSSKWHNANERATYAVPITEGSLESVESITIRTRAGDVLLEPTKGEARVVGKVRATTRERADATTISANIVGDTLEISVNWPDGKRKDNEGCDLLVYVPTRNGVTIDTSAGDVFVKGMAGPMHIESSAGNVEVHGHEGDVTVRTSAGDIRFWDIAGTADVKSSAGNVALHGIAAPSQVRTTAGDIYIKFHEDTAATIEAETSVGGIRFDGEVVQGHSATTTIGTGDTNTSRIKTSAGDIDVVISGG